MDPLAPSHFLEDPNANAAVAVWQWLLGRAAQQQQQQHRLAFYAWLGGCCSVAARVFHSWSPEPR
eukprot:COSAG05_NODE_21034_length_275_cov_0.579545_1_plen_64_part_10